MKYLKKVYFSIFVFLLLTNLQSQTSSDMMGVEYFFLHEVPQVTSAAFFTLDKEKAPGSVWTVSLGEISETPVIYVKDIFDFYAPGISIQQQGQSGSALIVRGVGQDNNSKTLYMLNGQSLNMKTHYGYIMGFELPFLGDMASMEVINGPGAILHGSGAINGFINVLSKTGDKYKGLELNYKYGVEEKLHSFEIGYGFDWGDEKNLYLYGGYCEADGFRPDDFFVDYFPDKSLWSPNYTDVHAYKIHEGYKLSGLLNYKDIEIQALFQRIQKGLNSLIELENVLVWGGTFTPERRYSWRNLLALRAKYTKEFSDVNSLEIEVPLEWFDQGIKMHEEGGEKSGNEKHSKIKALYKHTFLDGRNKFAVGAGIGQRDFKPREQFFEDDKLNMQESIYGDWKETEVFIEDMHSFNDKLTMSLGFRYDAVQYGTFTDPDFSFITNNPNDQDELLPRFATSYTINDENIIKFSYQKGFRWPDAAYYLYKGRIDYALRSSGFQELGELSSEKVDSYEINYHNEAFKTDEMTLSFDLNLYHNIHDKTLGWRNYYINELGWERYVVAATILNWNGYVGAFSNIDAEYASQGFEIITDFNFNNKYRLKLLYGYSIPKGVNSKENLQAQITNFANTDWIFFPKHIVKSSFYTAWTDKLISNLTFYYASKVNRDIGIHFNQGLNTINDTRFHIHALLKYQFDNNIQVSASVQNITGDDSYPPGSEYVPARFALGEDATLIYLALKYRN